MAVAATGLVRERTGYKQTLVQLLVLRVRLGYSAPKPTSEGFMMPEHADKYGNEHGDEYTDEHAERINL